MRLANDIRSFINRASSEIGKFHLKVDRNFFEDKIGEKY